MRAIKQPDGSLLVPARVTIQGNDTGATVVGDGMVRLQPGDPGFDDWLPFATDESTPASQAE